MKEQSQQRSEELESKASANQSLVPDNSIDGQYIETTQSVERKTTSGESVQTDAVPAQPQSTLAPDGATAGNIPAVASVDAMTTNPQSITAEETQVATAAPTDGTSALAEVPVNSQALVAQPPIVPLSANETRVFLGVKPDIKDMTLDEKFACLKQCFSYGYGVRKVLCEVFESILAEFKTYAKNREGVPTVEEAFKQRGLNYKTVYSAIQREKDRRAEDAQFFAAIKAEQSTTNLHGVDITDNDLPVGTKVILGDGTKGQVLTAGEKTAPDAEPSFEVVTEEGTSVQVKRGDLITLAEKEAAKAAAKAAKEPAKHTPEAQRETEEKETARIAAAAAKEDAALKSSDFYKEQYFQLVALINSAPKEMTPVEFAQTVNDNLRVAFESLNAAEAKLVKPAPKAFPSFNGTKGVSNLIAFLSADAVGRPSPLRTIFGGLDMVKFAGKLGDFTQRIADKFYDGKFEVVVAEQTAKETPHKTQPVPPSKPDQPPTTKVGDKSEPTPHGFYYEFIKDEKPYAVRDMNNPNLGILCKFKSKTEAERYINDREREAAEAMAAAVDDAALPQVSEKDYTEEEVAAMFASPEEGN